MVSAKELDVSLINRLDKFIYGERELFFYCDLTPLRFKEKGQKNDVIEEMLFTISKTKYEWAFFYEMHHIDPNKRAQDQLTYDSKIFPTTHMNTWFQELYKEQPETYEFLNQEYKKNHKSDLLSISEKLQNIMLEMCKKIDITPLELFQKFRTKVTEDHRAAVLNGTYDKALNPYS